MTRETLRLLDLPCDLVEEILSRVPATSLSRLRFTCKRWNDLIKDQGFIKKHLDKAAKQYMVLMLSDLRVYSMSENLHGVHDNVVDPQTLLSLNNIHNSEQVEISEIFHCDGLLVCTTRYYQLLVWNPCTGQIRWIQYSVRNKYNSEFSLGYENNKSCQSYKILRRQRGLFPRVFVCEIYEFSSHSWRDLSDVAPKYCSIKSKGVSLKGNTYWIASNEKDEEYLLLSFDFSTERFIKRICIPFLSFGADRGAKALSVVREERLAILYERFDPLKIEIWMMTDDKIDQTKVFSWSKFLSVDIHERTHYRLSSKETTFFIDEEKKAAVLCSIAYRYTINTDMVYIVGEDNKFMRIPVGGYRYKFWMSLIYNYVPSLVQINVMTPRRKRKRQSVHENPCRRNMFQACFRFKLGRVMTPIRRKRKRRTALVGINNHVM